MSDKVDQLHAEIEEGVAALVDGDDWQQWLRVAAKFPRYSFRNSLLIRLQRPDATAVMGTAPGKPSATRSAKARRYAGWSTGVAAVAARMGVIRARGSAVWMPCLVRSVSGGELDALRLGHPLVDEYLAFLGARARRNTWLAAAFDLKVFFGVVGKEPTEVATADVFAFIAEQRRPRRGPRVVRLEDGEHGLAARTIKRRLSSVSGLFAYLVAREDVDVRANPVPQGIGTRRAGSRPGAGTAALIRTPRTLPRVLGPAEVSVFVAALRTHRDRAMVAAMLLGGLRRCEVLGLRLQDVNPGDRRLFIAEGKGGHQRLVPISARFFEALGAYLSGERPEETETERLFVALRGPRRSEPLTVAGIDEVIQSARVRAGLERVTCHQLRHTCLTRLREAGMSLEAVQAQAGHRSIESTRMYLHLADNWVVQEYMNAIVALERGEAVGG